MELKKIKKDCPFCGISMHPVVMACDQCEVEVRGRFEQTPFSRLSSEDLDFLENFVLAGFSIKVLSENSGLGYVAIRNRLDRVIDSYQKLHNNEDAKHDILDRLERGEITPAAATEALERL
jgi:hypothetical protein